MDWPEAIYGSVVAIAVCAACCVMFWSEREDEGE